MSQRNYLGHAAVYSLTNGLLQIGGLVMLTLYTRLMVPAEYGSYALLTTLAEIVSMVLLVGGFRQAFLTFYQQAETDLDRRRVLTGTYLLFAIGAGGGSLLMCMLAGPIWHRLGISEPGGTFSGAVLLRLAFVTVLLDPLCIVPMVLAQVRLESSFYFVISIVRLVARIVLCTLLMLGLGVGGALLGTLIVNATSAVLLGWRELRHGVALPERARMIEMLRFAMPFLPGSLCFFFLHAGDRFFLAPCGTEVIGLYDLGYKFAQLAMPFTLVPLLAVWNNRMYEVARTPEAPVLFGRVFTWILSAYLLFGLGIALFVEEAVMLLAHSDYSGAALFTPLVLVGCGFQAASSLMDSGFYIQRRTDLKLYVTLAATVVMFAAYWLLIPPLGALGAALATVVGFAFLAGATWLTTRQIFTVHYEPGRLLAVVALVLVAWSLGRLVPVGWATSPAKLLAWLAVPALAWQLGLISSPEKEYLVAIGRRVWPRRTKPATRLPEAAQVASR